MRAARLLTLEGWCAALGITLGLAVSCVLALPCDGYFLGNVSFYWGAQACILVLVWLLRPRAAVVAGIALVLAMYPVVFGLWVRSDREGLVWLAYLFSFPGAAIGAVGAALSLRRRPLCGPIRAGSKAAGMAVAGILINIAIFFLYVRA
jgi:hypothetical protein